MMKNFLYTVFSFLFVQTFAVDNNDVLKIPIREHIKLIPEYYNGEKKEYKYTLTKYKADSLEKIVLADSVHAKIEITNQLKVDNGYLLQWKFSEYFRDTTLLSIAEKPSQLALNAVVNQIAFKVKYDKNGTFEELVNEDELIEAMDKNNEKEKELEEKVKSKSKNKKSDDLMGMMLGLMRYKVLEKSFYPIFSQYSALYGHTYIQDSLISIDDLEKQAVEEEETDELTKLLTASLSGGIEKTGGAKMQVDKSNNTLQIEMTTSVDMTEMIKSMSGLFSGMVGEMAGGFAEAFGEDTATGEKPSKEKLKESKAEIKKESEKIMSEMEMKITQIVKGTYTYKTKQILKLEQQKLTEGKAEGKREYENEISIFEQKQ